MNDGGRYSIWSPILSNLPPTRPTLTPPFTNQLSGEIPAGLGNLANLEWLHLKENQLSGEIPPELGNLANLKELDLCRNQLSGCVPSSLLGQLDMNFSDLGGLPFCP